MAIPPERNGSGRNGSNRTTHPPAAPADPPGMSAEGASLEELIAEAEALRGLAQQTAVRLGRLAAGLKQQRRQARAVQAAMTSLRQLRLGG